ncbi:WbqC family protein [Undibacterium sp. TC9W]|uniref:WbqC family protein n=1 Tax=Undibacterium sp. TC9W TaxID=3413053 RepID=UPI003BF4080A
MNNTIAIMQPYIFPYLGYFCLIDASDVFVFYDDVNFIQKGWINRNQILVDGAPYRFTVPLSNSSQNQLICDVKTNSFAYFKKKFCRQIELAYKSAPFYNNGMMYLQEVFNTEHAFIADFAISSITNFYKLIGIDKTFLRSSQSFSDSKGFEKADRLIKITKQLRSDRYINALGGTTIYDKLYFLDKGIHLSFVKPRLLEYQQVKSNNFSSGLSIIDVVMHNRLDDVLRMIKSYELV